MKKPSILHLNHLVPFALTLAAIGFCLMQTDDWKNEGAIVFSVGLLPAAMMISKLED
jgi:Na+/phosphate symporter